MTKFTNEAVFSYFNMYFVILLTIFLKQNTTCSSIKCPAEISIDHINTRDLSTVPEIALKKGIFNALIFCYMGQHECHFIKHMKYSLRHSVKGV